VRFRLAVDDSNWPLLTGDHCPEVVIKAGLIVYFFVRKQVENYLHIFMAKTGHVSKNMVYFLFKTEIIKIYLRFFFCKL
jgi:hypothetical protein